MEWNELFPKNTLPQWEDMANFIGTPVREIWCHLFQTLKTEYKIKPKMTYSVCSGKPGWNVKMQKSGVSYGTLYPESGSFSVFVVIPYKHHEAVLAALPTFTPGVRERYLRADDFMKAGKWIMFPITTPAELSDYLAITAVKAGKAS